MFRAGKPYEGRLAFDGTDHVDSKGRKLSTDGNGKFWYKRKGELNHAQKFHKGVAAVVGTTALDPHHNGVTKEDPHADGIKFHDDALAPTVTSHTLSYKEQA